jgi:hypothetical protein
MMKLLFAALAAVIAVSQVHAAETIKSGHVLGNGTNAERTPTDTSLIGVMGQTGSGLGANVASALGTSANASGGLPLVNGTPTVGNCLKWSSSGILDLGNVCGSGFRNRIINGGVQIDQRNAGASQTITAAAALAYTVDRWYAYSTGANVSGQRVASAGPSGSPAQYAYQFTGAASVTGIGFCQRIEAGNSYDLAGSSATLAVNLSNSLLTTVNWAAYYANSADSFGTLASPTVTSISSGSFTVNSTLSRYSTTINIPSAATTGLQICFTVGAQVSGTWQIGNVQVEPGSAATAFERLPVATILQASQRYYQTSYGLGVAVGAASTAGLVGLSNMGTNSPTLGVPFVTPMRVAPTVAYWDAAGNSSKGSYYNGSWTNNTTGPTIVSTATTGFIMYQSGASSNIHFAASAEL